jgi:hypothetical protein
MRQVKTKTVTERTMRLLKKSRLELRVFNECYVTERENSIVIKNKNRRHIIQT